ncbi:hypothetical protein C8Q75DRAFT_807147 [Abortiporus biennis]|nr:hypothetical protein C8Q75DRAFT_807147 [Abortiporus biennis]
MGTFSKRVRQAISNLGSWVVRKPRKAARTFGKENVPLLSLEESDYEDNQFDESSLDIRPPEDAGIGHDEVGNSQSQTPVSLIGASNQTTNEEHTPTGYDAFFT